MASCPSRIHHQLVSFFVSNPRHHALPNASAFIRGTALLPNDDVLPTADASTECFEENLLLNGVLLPNSAHMSVYSLYQFLVLTIWCAILDGREVLTQGLIRRIGTGETTNIWTMNWLPRSSLLKPVVCVGDHPPLRVCELIDQSSATWDKEKLEQFFLPMDIEVISNIPICTRRQDDFWAWLYEKRGYFSVRSAYRMLVVNKQRNTAYFEGKVGRSDTRAVEKEWSKPWNVEVPSKIKFFL
jgi:hypothetical protein